MKDIVYITIKVNRYVHIEKNRKDPTYWITPISKRTPIEVSDVFLKKKRNKENILKVLAVTCDQI